MEIIQRVSGQCNLIWLENLNLRGAYKKVILDYIKETRPYLLPLYKEIYYSGKLRYWESLDNELRSFAVQNGLEYATNNDSIKNPFNAPPVIVNYFYHEQLVAH